MCDKSTTRFCLSSNSAAPHRQNASASVTDVAEAAKKVAEDAEMARKAAEVAEAGRMLAELAKKKDENDQHVWFCCWLIPMPTGVLWVLNEVVVRVCFCCVLCCSRCWQF